MEEIRHLIELGLRQGELTGKVAVVTGAGQGIGRELSRALAWLGAQVVLAEIVTDYGEATEQSIVERGGSALFVSTDVAEEQSVKALEARVVQRYGKVDILVNNAAYSPVVAFCDSELALWDRVMAVNLRGTFLTCRSFVPYMQREQHGVIINMTSADAMPGMTAYIATKQGIAGFSQSLAAELGDSGIKVIAFGPGMVATPGFSAAAEGLARQGGATADEILSTAMSAEQSAATCAYLIARLAAEYHGESTDVYAVGDRIRPDAKVAEQLMCSTGRPLESARAAISRLSAVVAQMDNEFNQLPVFVRPIARSQFRKRTGKTAAEWVSALQALAAEEQTGALIAASSREWEGALDRLLGYCQAVPKETARFTKDEATLAEITRISQERESLIRRVQVVIRRS